jgi:hypothetical protein
MTAAKIKTLRSLVSELGGEVPISGMTREVLFYSARWDEIQRLAAIEARRQYLEAPSDVRCAGYALDILGVPNEHSEADQDEKGNWIVYWR